MVTEVPPKVCILKFQNRYIPPDYANDIDEGVFDFKQYWRILYRTKLKWEEGIRTNLIKFNDEKNGK